MSTTSKSGCFGCFTRLLLLLVFGIVLVVAMTAVFSPWAFFLGGRFHPLATWEGWGRMHSSTAGDYVLFVHMQVPARRGRRVSQVAGFATLCTPRGERFDLTLHGNFEKNIGVNTDGKREYLYMSNRSGLARQFDLNMDTRPGLDLYGVWHNPNLVADDHGTLSRDFAPDGTLYPANARNRPANKEVLQVTLHEGTQAEFDAECGLVKH